MSGEHLAEDYSPATTADLTQDRLNDLAGHVGEPEVTALEAIGEPGMVDAEQVQNRRLEIVRMDRVLRDVVTEVVG